MMFHDFPKQRWRSPKLLIPWTLLNSWALVTRFLGSPTTRVPQVHSCPPREGLVQGWESVCWGVEGILLIENKKFRSSKVSKFRSFKVSTFQNFEASKFHTFKLSKVSNSKNSRLLFQNIGMQSHTSILRFSEFQNIFFGNDLGFFLDLLEYLGASKIKNSWFWESWSRPLGPRTIKWWLFGFSQNAS